MGSGSCGNVIAALASFFIPGLGQLLQGRWVAALFMFVMTALLWLSETLSLRDRCRVVGQQLFQDHPTVDGLSTLHNRLIREGGWSRVTQLASTAGLRMLKWPQWMA